MVELLAQLQVHPVLRYLTLNGSTTFVRLIAHLKRNILQGFNHSQSTREVKRSTLVGKEVELWRMYAEVER